MASADTQKKTGGKKTLRKHETPVTNLKEWTDRHAAVLITDMHDEMQQAAVQATVRAMNESSQQMDVAKSVKRHFDCMYHPNWHCIVGKRFASQLTHSDGNFIHLRVDDQFVFLFRTLAPPRPATIASKDPGSELPNEAAGKANSKQAKDPKPTDKCSKRRRQPPPPAAAPPQECPKPAALVQKKSAALEDDETNPDF